MLGMGWFPDEAGGLNRYFRDLHAAISSAGEPPPAIVVGPASDAPECVTAVSGLARPLPARLIAFLVAARRAGNADLVDAHFALYSALPLLATALRRTPLVVHFHGPWAAESGTVGQGAIATLAKRAIERAVYRRAHRCIVLSAAFRRVLVEQYGVPPWKVEIIPPGVDLERFSPGDGNERRRLDIDRDVWVTVVARRLVPRMGLENLVRAWADLPSASGDRLLAVVGDGPLRPALEGLARELGVASSVRFAGRVSDEGLRDWYRAADISVVPSVALEGFGLVVLESLACGTPTLVTDVGGLPEAVAGLEGEPIVAAGNRQALAQRLSGARSGSRPLASPSESRAHAERFSWDRATARHKALYSSVVRPSRRRRPRIVYLDHCARLSGGEIAMARTLEALHGVDAHVILAEEGPLVSRLARAGISVEVLPMAEVARGIRRERVTPRGLPLGAAVGSGLYVVSLARRLRRLAPDLVETNSLKSALYGASAARLVRLPVIWHLRDRLAPDYLPSAAVRALHGAARLIPSGIVANSETTRRTLPPVTCPVEVIPSPIAERKTPTPPMADAEPFRIGVVGRIAPWKGQHIFLDAFARAFEGGSERAVLIGAPLFGEQEYHREVVGLADRLGLGDRVEFRGFRDDVPRELSRLDVLVHSSVIAEPLGLVVLEGLAAGLAVVVPNVGGPADVVRNGVNGLTYDIGDAGGLAAAMGLLRRDAALRRRLAGQGPASVGPFRPNVVAAQTMTFYERVLSAGR